MNFFFQIQIWWTLVAFGDQYWHLLIGRTVVGMTGGALFRIIPGFVSDIAQSE